ncbi:SGNH/GDSL hydrolase family protein [Flavobacterium franklandianum]|uniref:GDSL family lipase n=1 Tax=Flavobacterium franklandianum TaxID=2594430 RepID=A0A553CM14_9FLAO|nr:SGNH/GDSL hydrolase family protein [Flavobacterium franklandianum]TRX21576.1 GDSL family lipase [Flavobacterium franklandianum]
MILKKFSFFILLFSVYLVCNSQNVQTKSNSFSYSGRVELLDTNNVILIGPSSSVSFDFIGDSCSILLQSVENHQNYVSLELDGKYIGRIRIEKGDVKPFPITISERKNIHHLSVYKATEATNGGVLFAGTSAKLMEISAPKTKKKIELIGDSITSGFGNDDSTISCGTGDWYDQHNAYWAYGPILSRALDIDYVLSSVSGYGMYRNWNDEHINEPIIPDVYENLYLNTDRSKPYDFKFQPDLVSICLGTNDLSDGDGKKPRLPFNEEKFVSNYIEFIKTVYKHAPKTRIVLLNSPMVSGDRNVTFVNCLKKIIQAFENDTIHKKIELFEFQPMVPKGCGYHPAIADDKVMADQLIPFFKILLNEK